MVHLPLGAAPVTLLMHAIESMDLHRRRSVLVRMTDTGDHLETVRISNDPPG